jgi:hypothetical protein
MIVTPAATPVPIVARCRSADQNRALVYAAATGAAGVLVGVAIGLSVRRSDDRDAGSLSSPAGAPAPGSRVVALVRGRQAGCGGGGRHLVAAE